MYPITIDFRDWVFPHDNLPPPWRTITTSPMPATVMAGDLPNATRTITMSRDRSCRITQACGGLEQAHIIPRAYENWFSANDMSRYSFNEGSVPAILDLANTLLLRADIHFMLDRCELVIVPKLSDKGEYKLVTHVLCVRLHSIVEQRELYHNRLCQELYGIPREFLFARFAWSIFNNFTMRILETKGSPFSVRIRRDVKTNEPNIVTQVVKSVTAFRSLSRGNYTLDLTESSRKRRREEEDEVGLYYSYNKGRVVDIDEESDWYEDNFEEPNDEELGRCWKRERLDELFTPPLLSQSVGSVGSSGDSDREGSVNLRQELPLPLDDSGTKAVMPVRIQDE